MATSGVLFLMIHPVLQLLIVLASRAASRAGVDSLLTTSFYLTMEAVMFFCMIRFSQPQHSDKKATFLDKACILVTMTAMVFCSSGMVISTFELRQRKLDQGDTSMNHVLVEQLKVWMVFGSYGFLCLTVAMTSITLISLPGHSLFFLVSAILIGVALYSNFGKAYLHQTGRVN